MIAAIGSTIISLSVIGFGLSYNKALKTEKDSIEALISLSEHINTRITCFRQPLPQIYADFSNPFLDSIGFTDELRRKGLSAALILKGDSLGIGSELLASIRKFADGLGKSYLDDQIRLCKDLISLLKEDEARVNESLPAKTKLSLSLSGAVSALVAILFI